jgi:hypothetical protein
MMSSPTRTPPRRRKRVCSLRRLCLARYARRMRSGFEYLRLAAQLVRTVPATVGVRRPKANHPGIAHLSDRPFDGGSLWVLTRGEISISSAMRANDARLVAVGRVDASLPVLLAAIPRSLAHTFVEPRLARSKRLAFLSKPRATSATRLGGWGGLGRLDLHHSTRFCWRQLSHIARKAESSADDPTSASADFALPNSHGRDMAENWQSSRALVTPSSDSPLSGPRA